MKISKLFHWLYAILMLLPAFAIGVTCAYAIFNKNAYQSYSAGTPIYTYKYDTNEVNDVNDLIEGNIYTFTFDSTNTAQARIGIDYIVMDGDISNYNLTEIPLTYDTTIRTNYTYNGVMYPVFIVIEFSQTNHAFTTTQPINFIYGNTTYNQNINAIISMISKCENIPIESINTEVEHPYLDNVFYYSIDKVKGSPLFNWAYDSFLSTPITYITGLFGISADHISVMLMSYWLAISVIWLVFDMVMYVPLLVHRWIDKGVLE